MKYHGVSFKRPVKETLTDGSEVWSVTVYGNGWQTGTACIELPCESEEAANRLYDALCDTTLDGE